MPTLFDPIQIGDLFLPNRVVMSPLTRCRAGSGRVPTDLNARYYAQRASAGLIIIEATSVTPMGVGYPDTPGLWSDEQVIGWRTVTQAVHAAGGRIIAQLWHVGRISDPEFLGGAQPVAPSAIAAKGHVSMLRPQRAYVTPRALAVDELPNIVAAYRQAAINAHAAGFDGVEVHSANGYLLDQFLQDSTNQRQDAYGGSIDNRARLLLEVTDAVISIWGAGRVGVHLSPRGDSNDMGDSAPVSTFGYVADQLGQRKIAFIFTRESLGENRISPQLKQRFGGALIANEGFNATSAQQELDNGQADAIAFGKAFIANPDLPHRLLTQAALNPLRVDSLYGYGLPDFSTGYTDYPALPI